MEKEKAKLAPKTPAKPASKKGSAK
jgi:hypothetical protein